MLTVGCSFGLLFLTALRPYSQCVVLGIALLGAAVLIIGRWASIAEQAPQKALVASVDYGEHPLFFFKRADYWGWILILSAIPIFFLSHHLCKPLVVKARTVSKPTIQLEVAAVEPPAPEPVVVTKFPELNVNGLVCNGTRSTAVVNGLTVGIGEKVDGVRVVAIERWGITVEMAGRERHVSLPQ